MPSSYERPIKSAFGSVCNSTRLARNGRVICLALMKTSLGDDCVAVNLDYDAVKEVVQNYHGDCERQRLRMGERGWKFTLRSRVMRSRAKVGDTNFRRKT